MRKSEEGVLFWPSCSVANDGDAKESKRNEGKKKYSSVGSARKWKVHERETFFLFLLCWFSWSLRVVTDSVYRSRLLKSLRVLGICPPSTLFSRFWGRLSRSVVNMDAKLGPRSHRCCYCGS